MLIAAVLAACASAESAQEPRPSTSTSSTTTTTLGFVAPLPAPVSPEAAVCQEIANALVVEWQPTGRVEAQADCVPRTTENYSGVYARGTRSVKVIAYPAATPALYRHVTAHELGHAWAWYNLIPRQIVEYGRLRGLEYGADTRLLIDEDYAEVFAEALGAPTPPEAAHLSKLVAPITPDLIDTLCADRLLPC